VTDSQEVEVSCDSGDSHIYRGRGDIAHTQVTPLSIDLDCSLAEQEAVRGVIHEWNFLRD